jgi:hypothetical protein
VHAERAKVLAGLRSGDGPLSVRVRPSSIKHDRDRRATSTGEKRLVYVHAKSCLTLEPLRTLRAETKGQAEPARTGRGPSPAQCGQARGRVKGYGTRIQVQGPLISKAEALDRSTVQGPSKKFGMLGLPALLKTT